MYIFEILSLITLFLFIQLFLVIVLCSGPGKEGDMWSMSEYVNIFIRYYVQSFYI